MQSTPLWPVRGVLRDTPFVEQGTRLYVAPADRGRVLLHRCRCDDGRCRVRIQNERIVFRPRPILALAPQSRISNRTRGAPFALARVPARARRTCRRMPRGRVRRGARCRGWPCSATGYVCTAFRSPRWLASDGLSLHAPRTWMKSIFHRQTIDKCHIAACVTGRRYSSSVSPCAYGGLQQHRITSVSSPTLRTQCAVPGVIATVSPGRIWNRLSPSVIRPVPAVT